MRTAQKEKKPLQHPINSEQFTDENYFSFFSHLGREVFLINLK